jgi:hypothetical protein
VCRADNLTTFMCQWSRNSGVLSSWSPKGLSEPVVGKLYLYQTVFQLLDKARRFSGRITIQKLSDCPVCILPDKKQESRVVRIPENTTVVCKTLCWRNYIGFKRVRVVAKSAYWFRHVRPSVRPPVRINQRRSHRTDFCEI